MMNYFFITLLIPFLFSTRAPKKGDALFPNTVELFKETLWIAKTELSNAEYLSYIESMSTELTNAEVEKRMPNRFLWISVKNRPKPYEDFYFKHPGYQNYPVVNITREQATLFCEWKTSELNSFLETLSEKEKNGINNVTVRLPTEKEWMIAALGGEPVYSHYPWKGLDMRQEKGNDQGMFRANFKYNTGEIRVGKDKVNAADDLTAPVQSFYKNGYGLYNMCGNVSELIQDKNIAKGGHWDSFKDELRINSIEHYTGAAPTVGFRYVIEVVK